MTDSEVFSTTDPQFVSTRRYVLNNESEGYFNFPALEIPGLEHVKRSLSYNSSALQRIGYTKLPVYDIFPEMPSRPVHLRMEGRRFVDMLQQPIYGGTTKARQLARALVEEFQVMEMEAAGDNASRMEIIQPENVYSVVKKYETIIEDFYEQVPMFLQHVLSHLCAHAESIECMRHAREILQNYVQENIADAEEEIITKIVEMIEPNDNLLVIACSHLLLDALMYAADKFQQRQEEFSIILTQANDPTAEERLEAKGLNVTVEMANHLPYLLSGVTKAFTGCFEVSANGDILCRAGTLQLAILLRNRKIPLYFSAETFKFSNRILVNEYLQNAAFASDSVEFIFDIVNHKLVTGIICQLGCFGVDSLRILPYCRGRPDVESCVYDTIMNSSLSRNQTMQSNEESASGSTKE